MPPKTKPDTAPVEGDTVDETTTPDVEPESTPDPEPVVSDETTPDLPSGGLVEGSTLTTVVEPDPVEAVVPIATPDTVPITFSVVHETRDGITHEPDTTAHLTPREARHVLHIGHGRHADAPTEAGTANDTEEQGR